MDISSDIGREQHPCLHVALFAIVHRLHVDGREGEGGVGTSLHVYTYLATGLEVRERSREKYAVFQRRFWSDEEETFGQYLSSIGYERELVDSFPHL